MLKTNTKKAIDNIRAYIVANYNGANDITLYKDIANDIYNEFKTTYLNINLRTPYQQQFVDWCAGLPSSFDTCYWYNRSAIKDLGDILEETNEERERFTEQEACEMLSKLIYREILKVVNA